ncbi:MAG: DUF4760 domain-containing protein [Cyclobacteriaceae bacterium]
MPNVISLITIIGLFLTFWTLKANHDWNRRHYATNLIAEWNSKTFSHRKAIETMRPGLVDLDKNGDPVEITKRDATAIYLSNSTQNVELCELRFHFIELLNYFESISVAYRSGVGDQQIIEESVRSALIRWNDILVNFIQVVNEHRGYEPWEPYTTLVNYWKHKPFKPRKKTG